MAVPLSGFSGNALSSMKVIDSWIRLLNDSIAGSATAGHKSTEITMSGGSSIVERFASGGNLTEQYGDQSININDKATDFSQGQLLGSTEPTHVSINGSQKAFFLLSNKPTNANGGTGEIIEATNFFVTRGGEFHQDEAGFLRTKEGLYVIGGTGTNGFPYQNGALRIVENPVVAAGIATIDKNNRTMEEIMHNIVTAGHNDGPTATTPITEPHLKHVIVNDLRKLEVSGYGSHIWNLPSTFDIDNNGNNNTDIDGLNSILSDAGATAGANFIESQKVIMTANSLEKSNVEMADKITQLALANKIFESLTKVIQTDNSKQDNILNTLFR